MVERPKNDDLRAKTEQLFRYVDTALASFPGYVSLIEY